MLRTLPPGILGALLAMVQAASWVFGFFWLMSPLGVGFADWPADEGRRALATQVYRFSFFVGLPVLVLGQVAALILWWNGRRGVGVTLSTLTLLICLMPAVWFLFLMP